MKGLQKKKVKLQKLKKIKRIKNLFISKKKRFIKLFFLKKYYNLLKIKAKNKLKKKKQTFLSFYLILKTSNVIKVKNDFLTTNWGYSIQINNINLDNVTKKNEKYLYLYANSSLKFTNVLFFLNKELCLLKWNNIRQTIIFLNELRLSLYETTKFFIKNFAQLNYNIKLKENIEQEYYLIYIKQIINQNFLKKMNLQVYRDKNIYFNNLLFRIFQKILILNYFNFILNSNNIKLNINLYLKKNILNVIDSLLEKHLNVWDCKGINKSIFFFNKNLLLEEELNKKRQKIKYIYERKNAFLIKSNIIISINIIKSLSNSKALFFFKNYLWKRKNYFENINKYFELNKILKLRNKKLKKSRRKISSQLFYFLSRIEFKIKNTKNIQLKNNLLQIKKLLDLKLLKKYNQVISNNLIITNRINIKNIRKKTLDKKLNLIWNTKVFKDNSKFQLFVKKIKTKLNKIKKENQIRNKIKNKKNKEIKIKKFKIKTFLNNTHLKTRRKIRNVITNFKIKQLINKLKNNKIKIKLKEKKLAFLFNKKYLKELRKENKIWVKKITKKILSYNPYTFLKMEMLKEKLDIDFVKPQIKNTIIWRRRNSNRRIFRRKIREKLYIRRQIYFKNRKNQNFLRNIKINKVKKINIKKQKKRKYLQNIKKKKKQFIKPINVIKKQEIKTFNKIQNRLKKDFLRKLFKKIKIHLRLKKKFVFKSNLKKNIFFKVKSWNKSWRKKKLRVRRTWINIHPILKGKYTNYNQKKLLLTSWAGFPLNIFMINTLAFTKLSFKLDRLKTKHNNPTKIISKMDRDYINRYKYIAIYIKDLVRIGIISMFFKKPSFLAKFTAFQLAKLPKNRKETVFIRFLMKAIRTFSAGRKEIVALRMKFKGRVNRWRRTKFIMRTRGTFPFRTILERIEHGSAQAINRKGAVGIHIWIRYKPSFLLKIQDHILSYIKYSTNLKKIKRKKIKNIKI